MRPAHIWPWAYRTRVYRNGLSAGLPARLPVDPKHVARGGVDGHFHISAQAIAALDVPFVAPKFSMRHARQANIVRDTQGFLHRNQAAGIIGRSGRRDAEREACDGWQDKFQHGILLVESIDSLRRHVGVTFPRARWD